MTETEFVEQRNRTLDAIIMARMKERIPGEDEEAQFLRLAGAATLMGRFPLNGHTPPGEPAAVPAAAPLAIPVSPVLPVETPPVSPTVAGALAPGLPVAGETQEEVTPEPPPVTPKAEDRPDFSGREAAQLYIWECCAERKPINTTLVGQYLGTTLSSDIRKFITESQNAYRLGEVRLKASGQTERIEVNFQNLLHAIEHAPADDEEDDEAEPEPGELEALEKAGPKPKPKPKPGKAGSDLPRWWSEETARYCKTCQALIPPKRQGVLQNWEGKTGYVEREYCSRDCYQAGRVGRNRSSAGANFPETDAREPAAA